ncbi:hypothetical protein L0F63_001024 [Massospora cicadina]|nr:hypothetical protein L0F63_001024 [Massospora cicadina]
MHVCRVVLLGPEEREDARLPDALMDLAYPSYQKSGLPIDLPDTLVQISMALVFLRILLCGRLSATVLRRVLYVCGLVYLIRAPFIMITALPNPLITCTSTPNPNRFYDAFLLMTQQRYSCGDVLYSGHTIIFMACCLVWFDYQLTESVLDWAVRVVFVLWGIFCHLILIISTYHYTVDVVVAMLIVLFFWKAFHHLATTETFDGTYISRFILFLDQERYSRASIIPKPSHPVPMAEII